MNTSRCFRQIFYFFPGSNFRLLPPIEILGFSKNLVVIVVCISLIVTGPEKFEIHLKMKVRTGTQFNDGISERCTPAAPQSIILPAN